MKQVNSWSEVTDKEIEVIWGRISQLKAEITPVDCDGDPVIEIIMIDRRKYEPMHYFPVPYREQGEAEYEDELLTNLDIALEALRRFRKIKKICSV